MPKRECNARKHTCNIFLPLLQLGGKKKKKSYSSGQNIDFTKNEEKNTFRNVDDVRREGDTPVRNFASALNGGRLLL